MGGSCRKDGARQFKWRGKKCSLIIQVARMTINIKGMKD
jgi:hypothetical protein